MNWFKKKTIAITEERTVIPDGLWVKCVKCGEIIYKKELEKKQYVCPSCQYHFRVNPIQYLKFLLDENSFEEFNQNMKSGDPLGFKDKKKYVDSYKAATKKTGRNDAVVTGIGTMNGIKVVVAIMDFTFIGGSMGSVVGEKVKRAIDKSLETRLPLIIASASGGARMMEGALSLMQMAKTSAHLALLDDAGIPYISLLLDPTTGGTTASFAMLGDIHVAEPEALIGFAGQRVIKETIGQDLPEGFQSAEFVLEHGFLDLIVPRQEMKDRLSKIISFLWDEEPAALKEKIEKKEEIKEKKEKI
ncbi:MAG: acetyl-CoA carboxylase carboxyltransferase subunit beta [Calditrichia bacterium]|nr:acetyl-CoA carboxylase carboxyltransferase subunit beta [Calditrichia bacterium]